MALITIFSTPKPFTVSPLVALIQRNAIANWSALRPDVEIILVGEEEGVAEIASEFKIKHIPAVERNKLGTPLLSSIFRLAQEASDTPLMLYSNTDIFFLPGLIDSAREVMSKFDKFLVVGQRYDLDVREEIDYSGDWGSRLFSRIRQHGRLHPAGGSDYFIYPRGIYQSIPAFAIGRAGWDNWMLYHARWQGWPLIDATGTITIAHQDHDYSHLPNAQPHYRLPETAENMRLAGGRRTIFTLADCNFRLQNGRLEPNIKGWKGFWREVEIFPLVRLHSKPLAQLFFAVFHPLKAYLEFRAALSGRTKEK